MNKLKVGDIVYGKSWNTISKYVIERVTNTQAISGSTRFKIEYGDWVRKIDSERYHTTSYYIETPELKAEYFKYRMLITISGFDFKSLPTEDLLTIYQIIKPKKP